MHSVRFLKHAELQTEIAAEIAEVLVIKTDGIAAQTTDVAIARTEVYPEPVHHVQLDVDRWLGYEHELTDTGLVDALAGVHWSREAFVIVSHLPCTDHCLDADMHKVRRSDGVFEHQTA